MEGLWDEALSGINNYVKALGKSTKVTLAAFDSSGYNVVRKKVTPSSWDNITRSEIAPGGLTPLYDSAAKMLNEMIEDDHRKSVFVCMTDGYENASKEHTLASVKAKIAQAQKNDWGIVFLGADFDKVETVSSSFGVTSAQTVNITRGNLGATYNTLATKTSCYFASASATAAAESLNWTDAEKTAAVTPKVSKTAGKTA